MDHIKALLEAAVKSTNSTHDGRKVFEGLLSSGCVDRDQEVLLPLGADLTEFKKNPVLLNSHNLYEPSVGKIIDFEQSEKGIKIKFIFADTQKGNEFQYLYDNNFQKALSVGFTYGSDGYKDIDQNTTSFEVEVGGKKTKIDPASFEKRPRRVIYKWYPHEGSCVTVGANQEALVEATRIMAQKLLSGIANPAQKSLVEDQLNNMTQGITDLLTSMKSTAEDPKSFVPTHDTPIVEGAWDGSKARTQLAKYASSDGSGKKETISWSKFSKGFAIYDSENAENLTGYKLPHHYIQDGKLVANRQGVFSAMAALLGARGGVAASEADKKGAYNHLSAHYKKMEVKPPEYKQYTEEELKVLFPDFYKGSSAGETQTDGDPKKNSEETGVTDIQKLLTAQEVTAKRLEDILEALTDISIKLEMLSEMAVKGQTTLGIDSKALATEVQSMVKTIFQEDKQDSGKQE